MKTFKHSGDMGDVIYGLPVMRALGGGVLCLDPEGGESSPLVQWPNHTRTKLNAAYIEAMRPLFEQQDYIHEVRQWKGETTDYDLDRFRLYADGKRTLAASHLMAFGLPLSCMHRPWLTINPKSVSRFVVSRSLRYHGNYEFWEQLDPAIVAEAVFVGLEEEYRYFKLVFGHDIPYHRTASILEAAEVIAGSEHYFANQSLLSAIGQGIHARMTVELYRDTKTNFFEREGALFV